MICFVVFLLVHFLVKICKITSGFCTVIFLIVDLYTLFFIYLVELLGAFSTITKSFLL